MRKRFTSIAALCLFVICMHSQRVLAQCTIALSGTVTDETCPGFFDGFIDVSVSGQSGAVSYVWSTGDMTQDLGSVTSGTYIVTATDAALCVAIDTFVVTDAHGMTVSLGPDTTLCSIVNYLLVPNTIGATFYYWQNGDQTPTFTANAPGMYSIFVQNSFGCYDDDTLYLSEFPQLQLAIASTQPGCGSPTGALDVTAGGGVPPFSYLWSNSSTNEDLSGLGIGTYEVTLTDANFCTAVSNGIILPPTDMSDFTTDTNLVCSSDSLPFYSHSYGFRSDGANDYLRLDDTSLVQPGAQYTLEAWIQPLSISGVQQVVVEKRILSSDGISIMYNPTTRTVSARQQNSPYFVLHTSNTILQPGIWAHVALVVDGTYTKLYVNGVLDRDTIYTQGTDPVVGTPWTIGGGPSRTSFNGMIDEVRFWDIALTPSQVAEFSERLIPAGHSDLAFYLSFDEAPGGATATDFSPNALEATFVNANLTAVWQPANPMALDFLWNFGDATFNNSQTPTHNYQPNTLISNGMVTLTVTSQSGCVSVDSMDIDVHTPGNPNIALSIPGPFCQGDSVYLFTQTPYISYLWSTSSTNDSILVTGSGTYGLVADDGAGCVHTDSLVLPFAPSSAPRPVLMPADTVEMCEGDTLILSVGTGYQTYLWSNGLTTQTLMVTDSGAYSVEVSNGFGCYRFSDTTTIVIQPAPLATITEINDTLYASPGVYYQWYLNTIYIPGAIANFHPATVSGNYTVRVGILAECDAISDPYSFLVGMGDPASGLQVAVFPNPTGGAAQLRVATQHPGLWQLHMTNLQGQVVWQGELRLAAGVTEMALPMEALPSGAYFLKVSGRGGEMVRMVTRL